MSQICRWKKSHVFRLVVAETIWNPLAKNKSCRFASSWRSRSFPLSPPILQDSDVLPGAKVSAVRHRFFKSSFHPPLSTNTLYILQQSLAYSITKDIAINDRCTAKYYNIRIKIGGFIGEPWRTCLHTSPFPLCGLFEALFGLPGSWRLRGRPPSGDVSEMLRGSRIVPFQTSPAGRPYWFYFLWENVSCFSGAPSSHGLGHSPNIVTCATFILMPFPWLWTWLSLAIAAHSGGGNTEDVDADPNLLLKSATEIGGDGWCDLATAMTEKNDLMISLNAAMTGFTIQDAGNGEALLLPNSLLPSGNCTIFGELNLYCARPLKDFTNACSFLMKIKDASGTVHSWPMGLYAYRDIFGKDNKTETMLAGLLVLNGTTTCSATYILTVGSIFGLTKDNMGSGPAEHPPVPPQLEGYPPVPTVHAKAAPGDPPVVHPPVDPDGPPVKPTEEPDPPWLWPVVILICVLKCAFWTYICRRRCRRIRAHQDNVPFTWGEECGPCTLSIFITYMKYTECLKFEKSASAECNETWWKDVESFMLSLFWGRMPDSFRRGWSFSDPTTWLWELSRLRPVATGSDVSPWFLKFVD